MWLDKLRKMKDTSGLTTKEIAAQSGIPEPTLEKLFAGATKDPKLETMRQLVHFFGYKLDDLYDSASLENHGLQKKERQLSSSEWSLILAFRQLNAEGQAKIKDHAEDLIASGRYESAPCSSREKKLLA